MERDQCSALRPDGERCGQCARTGSDWCYWHDPNTAPKRQADRTRDREKRKLAGMGKAGHIDKESASRKRWRYSKYDSAASTFWWALKNSERDLEEDHHDADSMRHNLVFAALAAVICGECHEGHKHLMVVLRGLEAEVKEQNETNRRQIAAVRHEIMGDPPLNTRAKFTKVPDWQVRIEAVENRISEIADALRQLRGIAP